MDGKWRVEVVEYATHEVCHVVECASERAAERTDDGLNINLNHERFYTRICEPGCTERTCGGCVSKQEAAQ